jgi:hypothetical protein
MGAAGGPVVSPGPQANTATITGSDQFDPNLANNSATINVTPQWRDSHEWRVLVQRQVAGLATGAQGGV